METTLGFRASIEQPATPDVKYSSYLTPYIGDILEVGGGAINLNTKGSIPRPETMGHSTLKGPSRV